MEKTTGKYEPKREEPKKPVGKWVKDDTFDVVHPDWKVRFYFYDKIGDDRMVDVTANGKNINTRSTFSLPLTTTDRELILAAEKFIMQ